MPERWKNIRFQTPQDIIGVTWRFSGCPPVPPFTGYVFKTLFCFTLPCFSLFPPCLGFPLFGLEFCFACGHWIDASCQYFARPKLTFASLEETHSRIFT